MIAIIDYDVGNLFSLKSSFEALNYDTIVTSDENIILNADKIVLPGVGAFGDAAEKLRETGMDEIIKKAVRSEKPLLGICLGMQLLFDESYEYGQHKGLGLIPGTVVPMEGRISKELKIPHIGWNALDIKKESKLFKYIKNSDYVYFVHSYFAAECENYVSATAEYGENITAVAENGNVFGCQFHPEKSGKVGQKIIKAFCEL